MVSGPLRNVTPHTTINLLSVGHAGAMLQARRLGKELVVGVHSDEEILNNKGPTVMTLAERFVPGYLKSPFAPR